MSPFKANLNLLKVLMRMNLRSSDYRTLLGALWSLAGPLLTFAVLYFIFVDRFGRGITLFSLKLLTGVIVIQFLMAVIQITMNAMRQSRDVVVDSLTPSEVFLAAPLVVPLLKFIVEIGLCLALAVSSGVFHAANVLALLILSFLFLLLSVGAGLYLGVLNSLAADVGEIWQRIQPILLFVCPVFYSLDMLSPWGRWVVYWLNPATSFLISYQTLISGHPVPGFSAWTMVRAALYAAVVFSTGYAFFKKFEKQIMETL